MARQHPTYPIIQLFGLGFGIGNLQPIAATVLEILSELSEDRLKSDIGEVYWSWYFRVTTECS